MEEGTGPRAARPARRARPARILLAHDATASTCDSLLDALEDALDDVEIAESSSVDDARLVLRSSGLTSAEPHSVRNPERDPGGAAPFDLCFICLDLPPAPLGGVRLAQEALEAGLPVVLITRSLRWIPASAAALRALPWVTPDAGAADVERAVGEALASRDTDAPAESGETHPWLAKSEPPEPLEPLRHVGGE